ncbi:MAG TPA: DUF5916 domain-containing protein [Ignavibacteriales bacterium]|nr:DUF5916 domain-containing protein [Ignavibacteriales bacterium]
MKTILLCVLFVLRLTLPAQPHERPKFVNQINAVRINEKITIDAILNESVWQIPGCTQLIQEEPAQGAAPTQKSEVWLAYDEEAIYFAAKYYDKHPDSILARLVRRDFIWGDPSDGCVLYLDSYGDKRNGYFFYVSAAGAVADGLIENDVKQPNDLTWDAVWEGASRIDSEGWFIEMRIPFSQLRFKEGSPQMWGVNVERFISRNVETDMLAYTPHNESGFTSRFPELIGIDGIAPSERLEILPYVKARAEFTGKDPSDPFNHGEKYLPGTGLDIRAGLGHSLTLNGTLNPDFGQVEVDPAVVNLTDVESSFEEKRPFFTEGVTIFTFGMGGINSNSNLNWTSPNIFYSRRIGRQPQGELPDYDYADIPEGTHILGAAKITGKIFDGWRIGAIHAMTKREFAAIDLDNSQRDIEIEPLTYYGVIRAQKDYNNRKQGLGMFATFTNRFFKDNSLRNSINKNAFTYAMDGWTFLDEEGTYVLNAWGAISNVSGSTARMTELQRSSGHYFQRPDAGYLRVDSAAYSMTGYAGRLVLNKNRGAWFLNSALGFISPKFEINDLGFNSFSDLVNVHLITGYKWSEPAIFYRNAAIFAASFMNFDFGGSRTANGYYFEGDILFVNLYGASMSFVYSPESQNARRTRGGPLTLNPVSRSFDAVVYTDMRPWWVVTVNAAAKTGEDASSFSLSTILEIKAATTLTLQLGPGYSKDNLQAQWVTSYSDQTALKTYGRRYVFARLDQTIYSMNFRADWIISPKLSLQMYVQPLIASGKYNGFKALEAPKSYRYIRYGEMGSTLDMKPSGEKGGVLFVLDADGKGPAVSGEIENPDFNYLSLRGSAVLRWEYLPGSTLYLVWTQSRLNEEPTEGFNFRNSINTLFSENPDNIFMLKLSYWL